jgi:hypothetical protein
MYFEVEDYFLYDNDQTLEVTVSYLDQGAREFRIEYNSCDPRLSGLAQQFRTGPRQEITGSGQWREATWRIEHARFAGRSNGADFRLTALHGDLAVSKVTVRRVEP